MSVRLTDTRPYHNQPPLQQTCWRCGGSVCFKSLFTHSIWLSANIRTEQNIQKETALRLGVHSLINSEPSQWEHSDVLSGDEHAASWCLWPWTTGLGHYHLSQGYFVPCVENMLSYETWFSDLHSEIVGFFGGDNKSLSILNSAVLCDTQMEVMTGGMIEKACKSERKWR